MLIELLQTHPVIYFSIVLSVLISIVLHELAHGLAAIRQGDDTPIRLNRMTGNPVVHMGWLSIALVCVAGIGWGAMPVNPARFRSRYGEAVVAAAGPLCNVLLAVLGVAVLVVLDRLNLPATQALDNLDTFFWVFAQFNIVLAIFNLAPVYPLDGSAILANFSPGYRRWLIDHEDKTQMIFWGYFIFLAVLSRTPYSLFSLAANMVAVCREALG